MTICKPSGGVLTIYGEGIRVGSTFCSATRARQCLQHGCIGYLVYMVDIRVGNEKLVSNVPIVREFPNVFSKELSGVPPKK